MKDEKANCPNCGRRLAFNDARFCTSCGTSIEADGTATPAHAEPVAPRSRGTKIGIEKIDLDPLEAKPPSTSEDAPAIEVGTTDEWEVEAAPAKEPTRTITEAKNPVSASDARATRTTRRSSDPAGEGGPQAAAPKRGKDDQMVNPKPPTPEKRTIVEEGTRLKGELESDCPVVVNGHVAGAVRAPALTVSATGVVDGTACVGTIQCEGELAGEFDADRVELSGSVKDGTVIRAETIEMKLTAKSGKKQLVFGDVPDAARPEATKSAAPSDEAQSADDASPAAPVNGRPSQPPPPAN